ncbi:hypothetical protein ACH4SK_30780 [Streptomyces inhibens]
MADRGDIVGVVVYGTGFLARARAGRAPGHSGVAPVHTLVLGLA